MLGSLVSWTYRFSIVDGLFGNRIRGGFEVALFERWNFCDGVCDRGNFRTFDDMDQKNIVLYLISVKARYDRSKWLICIHYLRMKNEFASRIRNVQSFALFLVELEKVKILCVKS